MFSTSSPTYPASVSVVASAMVHQEDVGLVDLDLVEDPLVVDPLVVVVDRHGQGSLRLLLADHVLVEDLLDLLGRGAGDQRFLGLALLLFGQNLVAE
jgi:hypothetical protein